MADDELKGIWRDGQYLVAHHRLAQFPRRCIVCGDRNDCLPLSCTVRKRPGLWPLLFGLMVVFSPSIVIKPYVCPRHRNQELRWRWFGHLMVIVGMALVVVPTCFFAAHQTILSERADMFLIILGMILLWIWFFYRIYRKRIMYAKHIVKRDAWIQDVHSSVFDDIPLL